MWSQVLCMRSMSGGSCPPCLTCCRISAQWAIAREWSFLAKLSAKPDHHDALWAAGAPAAGAAAGVICRCGAHAAKPASSSTAKPAPTPFLLTTVSFCSSGCAPVGRIRRLNRAMLVPSDAGTQGSGAPGRC